MRGPDYPENQTRTYYISPKPKGENNRVNFHTVVKPKGAAIQNAPDRTLLLVETEGHSSYIFYRYRGFWLCIIKVTDFPTDVSKQILGLFTLLKGG
jgi:hypothetical protein